MTAAAVLYMEAIIKFSKLKPGDIAKERAARTLKVKN